MELYIYNRYKWPYKLVTVVIIPTYIGVTTTTFITASGAHFLSALLRCRMRAWDQSDSSRNSACGVLLGELLMLQKSGVLPVGWLVGRLSTIIYQGFILYIQTLVGISEPSTVCDGLYYPSL